MIFREKKKSSVLKRQKPSRSGRGKKKKTSGRSWSNLKIFAAIFLFSAVLGLGLVAKKHVSSWLVRQAAPIKWVVTLKVDPAQPLSPDLGQKVREVASKSLGDGSSDALNRAALEVQRLDSFARVSVVRIAHAEAVVEVQARRPILCVKADATRYVGDQGEVFGFVERGGEASCPSPVLTGLLDVQGRTYAAKPDLTLETTAEERATLLEAIALKQDTDARKLRLNAFDFQPFRGFLVTLQEPELLELQLGRAPFGPKLEKLSGILDKLREKGEQAARIELDYQGKAFIKIRKM